MVWVVECTLCNSLMWNIKYAVEPCSIVESIIHFRLLQKKISKNSQKISQKFEKKLKVFSQIPKKVWNLPRIDESNIHFWLVSLRLDSLEIRKNLIFKKKMFSSFWAFKIGSEVRNFNIFCPCICGKLQRKFKISEWDNYQKTKILKKIFDHAINKIFWKFEIFGFFTNQVGDKPLLYKKNSPKISSKFGKSVFFL